MNVLRILAVALSGVSLFLTGCETFNTLTFRDENIGLPLTRPQELVEVLVGVEDSREEVLSGERPNTFVGVRRTASLSPGMPSADIGLATTSGNPLAVDVADILSLMLTRAGYDPVREGMFQDREGFVQLLGDLSAQKGVYVQMKEWHSISSYESELRYDLHLFILDADGNVLAESTQAGVEDPGTVSGLDESFAASMALSTKLSYLFADDAIIKAMAQ